jgi:hypothetical protein
MALVVERIAPNTLLVRREDEACPALTPAPAGVSVVVTPGAGSLPVEEVLAELALDQFVLVPCPGVATHAWLAEVALRLGRDVQFSTSLVGFHPFPALLTQPERGGDQSVLSVAPAPPGWTLEGNVYRSGDVVAEVVPSGVVVRAAGSASADGVLPFSPAGWTLYVGVPGERVGLATVRAAERLLDWIGADERAFVKARVVGELDPEARDALVRSVQKFRTPKPQAARPAPEAAAGPPTSPEPSSQPDPMPGPIPSPDLPPASAPMPAAEEPFPAITPPVEADPAPEPAADQPIPNLPDPVAAPESPIPSMFAAMPSIMTMSSSPVSTVSNGAEACKPGPSARPEPAAQSGSPAHPELPSPSQPAWPQPTQPGAPADLQPPQSASPSQAGQPDSPSQSAWPLPSPPGSPAQPHRPQPPHLGSPGQLQPSHASPAQPGRSSQLDSLPPQSGSPGQGGQPQPGSPTHPTWPQPPHLGSSSQLQSSHASPAQPGHLPHLGSPGLQPPHASPGQPSHGSPGQPGRPPQLDSLPPQSASASQAGQPQPGSPTHPTWPQPPHPGSPTQLQPPPAQPGAGPLSVPDRSSTSAEQARFTAAAGDSFGEALAAVNAALATWPSLRQDASAGFKADLVAVCLYLSRDEATRVNAAIKDGLPAPVDAHIPCLASGIRRLPTHRRAVLRQSTLPDATPPGTLLTEPGFLTASMDLDITVPGAEVDVLIWPASARRTAELMSGRPVNEAVFVAGARFKALGVRKTDEREDTDGPTAPRVAVLFRELAPTEQHSGAELDERDQAVLEKLDRILERRLQRPLRLVDEPGVVGRLTTSLVEWQAIGTTAAAS